MTVPLLKIKVLPKPIVKGKMDVRFPASVQATSPALLAKNSGTYTFSLDMNAIAAAMSVLFQPINETFAQEVTAGASANIANNTAVVRVNKAVGSPTTLIVPDAYLKTCDVLISDWKGDAGTNNITVTLSGTDKFPGGLTSWTIASDGGSIFLRRIPGAGYAL